MLPNGIQHPLLDFWPRATPVVFAKDLVDHRTAAPGVEMDGGDPSNLELRRDVIPKGVRDLLVVGDHNVRKDHRRPGKFRIPVKHLKFLFEHSTSGANRTAKFQKDELVYICGLEISATEKVSNTYNGLEEDLFVRETQKEQLF